MTAATARRGSAIHVEAIGKRFGGLQVFKDISFTIPPGDVLGVIGPNGAGKTTLINVICGKLPPSSGRVRVGDVDMTGRPLHAMARAGVVRSFQQTNIFRAASVRENIARAVSFSSRRGPDPRDLTDILDEFELASRLDEPSDSLPYGLQKMLGLVLTFAMQPGTLLLDEPAAGLEVRERGRIDSFVTRVRETFGCSVLIVEHDMDLVKRLCPGILVLDAGRLVASGPPEEVLRRKDVIEAYVGAAEEEDA